jgi:hypothetical protein
VASDSAAASHRVRLRTGVVGRAREARCVVGVGQRGGAAYQMEATATLGQHGWNGGRGIEQRGAGLGDGAVRTAAHEARRGERRTAVRTRPNGSAFNPACTRPDSAAHDNQPGRDTRQHCH